MLAAAASNEPVNLGQVGAGEGPAWSPAGELYFTGGGRIYRRDAAGKYHVFRDAPNGGNGLLFDREGRLIACEHENRRVTRTEKDGRITVLADRFEGKRFNSPNDLSMDAAGRIYFSDPRYGRREDMELPENVYRIDAPGRVVRVLGPESVERPNGLLVSRDGRHLYVADNNNNTIGGARKLWRFTVDAAGDVDPNSRMLLFDWKDGRGPDGLKMDGAGRLYVAAGRTKPAPPYETAAEFKGGIYVLSPAGKLLRFVPIPVDEVTNCAFGGPSGETLYITAGGTLWSLEVPRAR